MEMLIQPGVFMKFSKDRDSLRKHLKHKYVCEVLKIFLKTIKTRRTQKNHKCKTQWINTQHKFQNYITKLKKSKGFPFEVKMRTIDKIVITWGVTFNFASV